MKRTKKAFTLAELLITIAVMSLVLALVVAFVAASSESTKVRTAQAGTIQEIESLNSFISDWFYSFDTQEFDIRDCTDGTEEPEYIYDYINDKAIKVNTRYVTIQNKDYTPGEGTEQYPGGLVPFNYQLVYSIDRNSYVPAISAYYLSNKKDMPLYHVTDINFVWNVENNMLKCIYTYDDAEQEGVTKHYTLVLTKHSTVD